MSPIENIPGGCRPITHGQSSVSDQIKRLEEDLEIKLFDRIGHHLLIADAKLQHNDDVRRIKDLPDDIRSEMTGNIKASDLQVILFRWSWRLLTCLRSDDYDVED